MGIEPMLLVLQTKVLPLDDPFISYFFILKLYHRFTKIANLTFQNGGESE